ncbi:hypothetical protein ACFQI7_06065 [Paenibacillus allorhizosphaerae]|uniref:Integrase SAM-like N-terminal domain-containing protein n=1 Tax=Paenibacillus allorhizosphaerae TaxID=2849866 RepID=A0ABN7TIU8_9BACL|nr:hypothetical protein [Paenibacillus allorhizosphaerae]CAG7634459.1 hypothetical protein PAECIP111802_02030 [Paenibacillus allorhizosphaerae]
MKILLSKRNEESLTVKLIYFSQEDVTKIKQLPGRRWLPEEAVWSAPYTLGVIEQLLDLLKGCSIEMEPALAEECESLQYKHTSLGVTTEYTFTWNNERETQLKNELIARGYSSKTIKAYCGQVERFYGYTVEHGGSWNDRVPFTCWAASALTPT